MAYIPSLTLPPIFFTSPLLAIGFPVAAGTVTGLLSQPGSSKPKSLSDKTTAETGQRVDPTKERYLALKQPPGSPPAWLFGPAWTILYSLMGYASYRAWTFGMSTRSPRIVEDTRMGATLYTVQLVLNYAFMPLFFKLGQPIPALIDMFALTGTVTYLTYVWNKVDPIAAYCMVPYIGWLSFATYLCAGTGYLNNWNTNRVDGELVTKKKE